MAWEKRLELGAEYQTWRIASGYCCFVRRWRLKPWIFLKKMLMLNTETTRNKMIPVRIESCCCFYPSLCWGGPRFQTCPRSSNQNMTRSSCFRLTEEWLGFGASRRWFAEMPFVDRSEDQKEPRTVTWGKEENLCGTKKTPTMKCTVAGVRTARKRANETTSCTAQKGRRRIWRHHHGFGVHFSPLWTI